VLLYGCGGNSWLGASYLEFGVDKITNAGANTFRAAEIESTSALLGHGCRPACSPANSFRLAPDFSPLALQSVQDAC